MSFDCVRECGAGGEHQAAIFNLKARQLSLYDTFVFVYQCCSDFEYWDIRMVSASTSYFALSPTYLATGDGGKGRRTLRKKGSLMSLASTNLPLPLEGKTFTASIPFVGWEGTSRLICMHSGRGKREGHVLTPKTVWFVAGDTLGETMAILVETGGYHVTFAAPAAEQRENERDRWHVAHTYQKGSIHPEHEYIDTRLCTAVASTTASE